MVADAFAMCGWQATYLGATVPVEDLLSYIDRVSVDVLALSASLARDVLPIRRLIDELAARPVAPIVLVGGRPFSMHQSLWRAIGADGFAITPLSAVALANELICDHCTE
jgi:methanogenic corrinoid protein MtbC1